MRPPWRTAPPRSHLAVAAGLEPAHLLLNRQAPYPLGRGTEQLKRAACGQSGEGQRQGLAPGAGKGRVRSLAQEELVSPYYGELNEYWDSRGDDVMLRSDESNAAWAERFVKIDALLQSMSS